MVLSVDELETRRIDYMQVFLYRGIGMAAPRGER